MNNFLQKNVVKLKNEQVISLKRFAVGEGAGGNLKWLK